MTTPFRVESTHITALNDIQLTKLLKLLLHLEAQRADIAQHAVDVGLNINVGDGGEDGRISWEGDPRETPFLPSNLVQFQNKATDMGPADCAKEILTSEGKLKPLVEEVFDAGGAYILFISKELNGRQKKERIERIRAVLSDFKKDYSDTASISIFDASIIEGWVNNFIPTITAVLNWIGQPIERGLKTWDDWSQVAEYGRFEFVSDEPRELAKSNLRGLLLNKQECARIIGLSGMGKTRLAFEALRDVGDLNDISKRVVYLDAGTDFSVHGLLSDWVQQGLEGVIVVDNCDISLHDKLRLEVKRSDSKLSLLTLDYNLHQVSQTETIQLNPLPDSNIKEMLEPVYGEQIDDLDRIIKFAQGFPQMAVLLADARLDKEPEMGRLSDDSLANKLLWGESPRSSEDENILRGCALFDKFGVDGEVSTEYEFIADFVSKVEVDPFYECVKRFEERGLIDRRGRYASLVPKPLAIRLSAEWWRRTRPERQRQLILSDMPGNLLENFCNQIALLDFLPEVKELTTEICGVQGPFGQAGAILSNKGSRLFRALAEVNPQETSRALLNVLSIDIVRTIEGQVRRNLVSALEYICFHENCFESGAEALLLLASCENESWSNNSTGTFKQFFGTFLSGTEARPEVRFRVLDKALNSDNEVKCKLAIEALSIAIDTSGRRVMRVVGPEYQGSGEPLKEWRPKLWQDAFNYWEQALDRLYLVAAGGGTLAPLAKNHIASGIRGLVRYGRVNELDKVIRGIVGKDGPLWPEALDSIKDCLKYDSDKMPDEGKNMLESWILLLTPDELGDRLTLIVSEPPHEHEEDKDGNWVDTAAENAKKLAQELAPEIEKIIPFIGGLLEGQQNKASWFGRWIVLFQCNWEPVLSDAIEKLKQLDNPNGSFIFGMLQGVHLENASKWGDIVDRFAEEAELREYYADVIITGEATEKQLYILITLVEAGHMDVHKATLLSYGGPIEHLEIGVIVGFIDRFSRISDEAAWIATDILAMFCHGNAERWEECKNTIKSLIVKLRLDKEARSHNTLEFHHWKSIAVKLIETEGPEFSKLLVKQIISSYTLKIGYSEVWHYVQPVLRKIFQEHGAEVWPIFSGVIKEAEGISIYNLMNLLNDGHSFDGKKKAVISDLPEEVLKEWCFNEVEFAPEFLASTTDVFLEEDGEYVISSRAQFLIDNFGENDKVLSSLSSNMSSFGWCGSLVPYLEKEVRAIEPFKHHQKLEVRRWAENRLEYLSKSIVRELRKDEEEDWGYH